MSHLEYYDMPALTSEAPIYPPSNYYMYHLNRTRTNTRWHLLPQ